MMENWELAKVRHAKPWLVQLATGEKIKVTDFIANYEVKIQDHVTRINLDILHLGSYDIIIGIDWLKRYQVILNCFDKTFTYVAEDQTVRKVKCTSKLVSLRHIIAMQLKKCMKKGCKLYVVWVTDWLLNENPTHVRDHLILSEFMDVFIEEIPWLPHQQEIYLSIDIVPRDALI